MDRKALVAVSTFLALQLGVTIWWASAITTTQKHIMEEVRELKITINKNMDDRYRGEDADKDFAKRDKILQDHEQRIRELEKCQAALDR